MDLEDEDEVTDIREQIFHNTVREHIVSTSIQFKIYFVSQLGALLLQLYAMHTLVLKEPAQHWNLG